MPKIPTLLSGADIHTSQPGGISIPQANAAPIGEGLMHLSAGIGQLADAGQRYQDKKKAELEKKVDFTEQVWTTDSLINSRRALNEWAANPENNSKETYAADFGAFADEHYEEAIKTAPTPKAMEAFKAQYFGYVEHRYASALDTSSQTKVNNVIANVDTQIATATEALRTSTNIPGAEPIAEFDNTLQLMLSSVEAQFGSIAPGHAKKIRAHIIEQAAHASMDVDPAYAKQLVAGNTDIDELKRSQLNREIDGKLHATNSIANDQFNTFRENWLTSVTLGKTRDKIDISLYQKYFPADKAQVIKNDDDYKIDVSVGSKDVVDTVSSWSASEQAKYLKKISEDLKTIPGDEKKRIDILNHASKVITKNLELQQHNTVAWLRQFNPEVSMVSGQAEAARKTYEAAGDNVKGVALENYQVTMKNLADSILKYQGHAPEGADSKLYLGLPTEERALLSVEEASSLASRINKGAPSEALAAINQAVNQYPGYEHIVYNDLTILPDAKDRIKQEYQLAFANKDAWWLDDYLGAIKQSKGLASITEEKSTQLKTTIANHPTWKAFQQTFVGDNSQRADEISGYFNGVQAYAIALIGRGQNEKSATSNAIKMLISEQLGFTFVNGQPMAIPRNRGERSNKGYRTDDEITDLGRRLTVALRNVPVQDLPRGQFDFSGNFDDVPDDHVTMRQNIRDFITTHGFFRNTQDGNGVSLYVMDNNGAPKQILDKNKRPLVIDFEDLPPFLRPQTVEGISGEFNRDVSTTDVPEQPQATYDLVESHGFKMLGTYTSKTNWPVRPSWMR